MAVVCFWEPDEKIRNRYFNCQDSDCGKWMVPGGPGDLAAAAEIGYKPYRIPHCPRHSIWASTKALIDYPIFISAMRFKDMPLTTGGVLQQPANMGCLVHHGRKEFEWFMRLAGERGRKR